MPSSSLRHGVAAQAGGGGAIICTKNSSIDFQELEQLPQNKLPRASPTSGIGYEELPAHRRPFVRRSDSFDSRSSQGSKVVGITMHGIADVEEDDVYLVKQKYGYLSIFFSLVQTIVLVVMVYECGIAPLRINPMVGPYPDALDTWGGKNSLLILEDGEWWRLATPILLHAGIIHLFCNISVQLETGAFFEREWGSTTWLVIYLSSALGSSILSTCAMPNSISVGSSGAVMGLFGGKLAEVFCRSCEATNTSIQARIGHEVRMEQLNGVLCSVILVALMSFIPFVDWAAHLGGLVAGVTVGWMLFSSSPKSYIFMALWFCLGSIGTVAYFTLSLRYMTSGVIELPEELRDVCGYYKQFFEDYECNCMQLHNGDGD